MKKAVKISVLGIVLLFFILSAAGFLILKTDTWKSLLLSYANSQLNQRFHMRIEPEGLSGNLFYNLKFDRLRLTTVSQYEIMNLTDVSLTYNLKSLLGREHNIFRLRVDSLKLAYPGSLDSLLACLPEKTDTLPATTGFNLKNIAVNHCNISNSQNPGRMVTMIDSLKGDLTVRSDTVNVNLRSVRAYLPALDEFFDISNVNLSLIEDSLYLKQCQVNNQGTIASLSGKVIFSTPLSSELTIDIANLKPREKISGLEQVFQKNDKFDLKGLIETKGRYIRLDLGINGQWRGRTMTSGQIAGTIDSNQVDLHKVSFHLGSEQVSGKITGQIGTFINAELGFKGIDTYAWGLSSASTNLQGNVRIEISGPFSKLDQVTATIDLQESKIAPLDFNHIYGKLIYKDGFLAIVDTFRCSLGETGLKIEGIVDLNNKTVDARAYFTELNANLLASFGKIDTLVGTMDGFVEATGNLTAPDLRGWLRGDQFGLPNLKFEESVARFGLVNIREQKYGDIYIEATNCQTKLIPETIPLTSLIVRFEGDTTVVQMFKAVSNNLDLEVKGNIVRYTDFNLNSIKISRSGNVLQNVDPIHFSWKEDTIALKAVKFRLNDGSLIVSGRAIKGRLQNARLDFANLSIEPFNAFIKGSQGVRGVLEGTMTFEQSVRGPNYAGELNLKDARLIHQNFKNIHLKGRLDRSKFILEDLAVKDTENGVLSGKGFMTCNLEAGDKRSILTPSDSVSLALNLNRFDMSVINKYVFNKIVLDGKITGLINVYNCLGNPQMNYDLTFSDPIFDKITGTEMTIKGIYQKDRLSFTEATLNSPYGTTRGRGYMPYSISLVPGRITVLENAPLSMNFSMKTSELDFLTVYMDDVESINGDFNLALSITGTPAHPIRSGNVSAKDAVINISTLENPITGVAGSAVLKDNVMEIISLTGFMKEPHVTAQVKSLKDKIKSATWDVLFPPKIAVNQPNLTIGGTIDFTSFFRPQYNLTLKGEELYLRTLLAEQEGVVTGTITMTGRDTIVYDGEVEVDNFILRNEFARSAEVIENKKPSKFYSSVNLHLIIPGSLDLKNSQLDGSLDGEMWIIRNGDEPFRFSGTLDIVDGSFFYYGWEFDIVRGSISFDPIEFNPTLDIEAEVDLASYGLADTASTSSSESELVTVYLTGYLDNPSLEFESANYSQSDILMFLARAQNIGSESTGQDQFSTSAVNVVGSWFERQIERNVSRMAGLDDFELRTSGNLLSANPSTDQWSVVLGRKLAPNLYVKYERTFSLIEPNQQFGLEYRINRNMSIAGDVDQEGLLSINYRYKYRY